MKYSPKFITDQVKSHPRLFAAIAGLLLVLLVTIFALSGDEAPSENAETATREVDLLNVAEYQSGAIGLTAPSADGNSFVIRSESSGMLVSVARPGRVNQGAVIASFNNASERAALVQAEGVLEAARAGALQSDIGVDDAETALVSTKNGAINSLRGASNTYTDVLYNSVDELFSNPRISPGLKISAGGQAPRLSDIRLELQAEIRGFESDLATLNSNSSMSQINSGIDRSIARIGKLQTMVSELLTLLQKHEPDQIFTASELTRLSSEFSDAGTSINTTLGSLQSAKTSLTRADEAVNSARVGGTGGTVSAANASVKQAQGAYQAALAAYNKTIVRAPFAGTITSINVKAGEILNYGADVAIITPNEGVETVSSYILPLSAVKYTPDSAFVFIVNSENKLASKEVETGLVTAESIAVTGLSGDENVVSDVRGLKAGTEVKVK